MRRGPSSRSWFLPSGLVPLVPILLLLLPCACTGLAPLDDGGEDGEAAVPLTASETESVRVKIEDALESKRYESAWNLEVAAGADRARLEDIAVRALEAQSRHAPDMFTALRERFGALDAQARGRVKALVGAARSAGRWERALDVELITADDPPAFTEAWAVYREAPPAYAEGMLEALQEAKAEALEREGEQEGEDG